MNFCHAVLKHKSYPLAFGALLGEFVLVALDADNGVAARYEALRADGLFAFGAQEALLMPGATLVLVLPHCRLEGLSTAVATSSKFLIETVWAEDGLLLGREGAVGERILAV